MNLNYNKHLENVIKSISYKSLLLAKIRKYITQDVAICIYKTMILPVLEYGDVLYDGVNKKLIGKLQTIQNRCLRTCLLPQEHTPTIRLDLVYTGCHQKSISRPLLRLCSWTMI